MALTKYKLGELISPCDERNYEGTYTLDDIKGISTGKEFIDTKANMDGVSLSSYKVVNCQEFAYVADTSRRGEKIAIAFNNSEKAVLISSIYTVFRVSKTYLLKQGVMSVSELRLTRMIPQSLSHRLIRFLRPKTNPFLKNTL